MKGEYVVELGPGTGAVTRPLIRNGYSRRALDFDRKGPEDMTELAEGAFLLRRQFSLSDACSLDKTLGRKMAREKVFTVVSSLPFSDFAGEIGRKKLSMLSCNSLGGWGAYDSVHLPAFLPSLFPTKNMVWRESGSATFGSMSYLPRSGPFRKGCETPPFAKLILIHCSRRLLGHRRWRRGNTIAGVRIHLDILMIFLMGRLFFSVFLF